MLHLKVVNVINIIQENIVEPVMSVVMELNQMNQKLVQIMEFVFH